MQNTPQTFRGAPAPGVNFAEHSYDNHVGVHCQPSGYQPYPNQPYHPLPSPRPHHYANHQMQQNMPYRHPGGAYAPNQNQYGSNINQDIYRNHSGYAGGNNRNMSSKPWTENNSSAEMMAPYGQVSHPQMMNNPNPQMPVSTMRSPPHATSNINPAPPQGQQHYHQMQSPAHSPHSWSQAQIPSPVMHSSRTTPSPLSTHVRSPGHSQPFSPPAAHGMNIQPHPQPPENGQMPQAINSAGGNDSQNPNNPLHSLQKMVMLDQESKAMMPMMGDGSDQFTNHCGSHNYVPEECVSNESKDSVYSTYYNMDENRFESKPSGSGNNSYPNVQQVSNCNFPVPPHLMNSDEVQSNQILPNSSSNVSQCLQSDQNSLVSPGNNPMSSVAHSNNPNIGQNDCTADLSECPPHAESAPMFTDQTKAAVSTNSEQALESKSDIKSDADKLSVESPTTNVTKSLDSSEPDEKPPNISASVCDSQNQSNVMSSNNEHDSSSDSIPNLKSNVQMSDESQSGVDKSVEEIKNSPNDDFTQGKEDVTKSSTEMQVGNQSSSAVISNEDVKITSEEKVDSSCVSNVVKDEVNTDADKKILEECSTDEKAPSAEDGNSYNDRKPLLTDETLNSDSSHDPVKVVIHRIRKDDTLDTWHVPPATSNSEETPNSSGNDNEKTESKVPNVGPQIVILSPATSDRKFGFHSSVDENSVITVKEEKEDEGNSVTMEKSESNSSANGSVKNEPGTSSSKSRQSPDKKRGRPVGSKNKSKPSNSMKKKKGKKGNKKKKFDSSKIKSPDALPKIKKIKNFNGPYVHIIGSRENPSSISVVNVAQKEEEKVSKVPVKRNFSSTVSRIKKKPVGHLSTLSPTYDAFNRDKTWLCIFCHKGSHHGGLGDLYGPYYIKDKNYGNSKSSTPSSSTSSSRSKKRKSDHEDSRASKKSKQNAGHSVTESTPVSRNSENTSDTDLDLRETWIHEDCAVWCQSISLMGEEVQGLEEAVAEAYENKCCKCSLTGATLGCWGKGCKELYHFSCAKETGCQMDIEKFALLCPKHQKRSPERQNRCQ